MRAGEDDDLMQSDATTVADTLRDKARTEGEEQRQGETVGGSRTSGHLNRKRL